MIPDLNNKYFVYLNEENRHTRKPIPTENIISISEFKNACFSNVVNNYSIKFTLKGIENYKINKNEFKVPEMSFLTASGPCDSIGFIESKFPVTGLCIDVNMKLINEAHTILSANGDINLDNNLAGYFKPGEFMESVFPFSYSELGTKLLSVANRIKSNKNDLSFIDEEMFLDFAESIIRHESENLKKMDSLSALRISTKKEILKRLMLGKNFIDDNFNENLNVKDIARISCLSEFHFFRSFKEAFGISPHNYLIKRRLQEAQKLVQNHNFSVGEIAFKCGFADIHSFSKSYKKHFGYAPSTSVKN